MSIASQCKMRINAECGGASVQGDLFITSWKNSLSAEEVAKELAQKLYDQLFERKGSIYVDGADGRPSIFQLRGPMPDHWLSS